MNFLEIHSFSGSPPLTSLFCSSWRKWETWHSPVYCFLCPLLFKPRNYIWVLLVTGDKQHLFYILMQSGSQVPACQTGSDWAGNLPDFNPPHLLFVWRKAQKGISPLNIAETHSVCNSWISRYKARVWFLLSTWVRLNEVYGCLKRGHESPQHLTWALVTRTLTV